MNSLDNFIEMIENQLPDLIRTKELVEIGIYNSPQAAYQARLSKLCPPWLRIPRKGVVYPKAGVVAFLRECESKQVRIGAHVSECLKNAQKPA